MTSPGGFTERLMLAVEATDRGAESTFLRISGAAEQTSRTARDTGEAVARAADRVQQARLREADAADAVRLAAQRLQEVNERATATESQRLAAQQRLEQAQRRQAIATREVERATEAQTAAMRQAETATEQAGDAAQRTGVDLADLARKGAAFAGGFEIGQWATGAISGFLNTARGAQQLAASMNATVEEGGQLATLFGSLGLESNDLLEIQAEFAQVVADDATALSRLGAQLVENADGTTNWAGTLRSTLAALQRIPDATERNRQGFRLFGEEGYKQLATLLNSSRSVDEAFDLIGTPVNEDDLRAVQEFDNAMLELNLTSGDLGRTIGTAVVPLITGLVDAGQTAADAIGAIPGPIAATTAAALLFGLAKRRAATDGTLLAGVLARVTAAATAYSGAATRGAGASALLGGAMRAGRGAVGGLTTALGGPLGVALVGLGAGFALVNELTAENRDRAEAAAQANTDLATALAEAGGQITATVREQAATSASQAGIIETAREAGVASGDVTRAILEGGDALDEVRGKLQDYADANMETIGSSGESGRAYTEAGQRAIEMRDALDDLAGTTREGAGTQQEIADELGGTASAAEKATAAVDALEALIAEGTTSGQGFADAVRAAATAQGEASVANDTAKAALDAYNAITRDAIDTTLGLIDAQIGARDSRYGFQSALDAAAGAEQDASTRLDEVGQAYSRLRAAALNSATSSADAAVEQQRAAGAVLTSASEASIRAESMLTDLRQSLNAPGLTKQGQAEVQALIDRLEDAQKRGDIEAVLTLTGADETGGEIDEATEDRDTTVRVETRNGPAVKRYLDGLADERLAKIRVESRNGPAVREYLDGLAAERLAIIRVETRGGPAVDRYLDDLARERGATIAPRVGNGLAGAPGVGSAVGFGGGAPAVRLASVDLDLRLTGTIDRSQAARAERGRAIVEDVRAYEQRSGAGWRRT
jgi:hypothetical protein